MPYDVSARLASILLRQRGELSRSEIAALPWIEDDSDVDLIISILLRNSNITIRQQRIDSALLPDWEDTLVLESKPTPISI